MFGPLYANDIAIVTALDLNPSLEIVEMNYMTNPLDSCSHFSLWGVVC